MVDQVIMREQTDKEPQLLIPKGLQAEVFHLTHKGHQGQTGHWGYFVKRAGSQTWGQDKGIC